ncbi:hypothetical protein MBLNU230_g4211t1 [Neophaeotheca triangularis]
MSKTRKLLITFDAFGTLFYPKRPIAAQYGEVARQCGLSNIKDEDVQQNFKKAFKQESKANPNYGKVSGMNPSTWWTNIINNTFQPFLKPENTLPSDLAPKLLHRFSSSEGYALYPDVVPLIKAIRGSDNPGIMGIVTNSDDRVPSILRSLGLQTKELLYPSYSESGEDFAFTAMSYDIGFEKPDKRIFAAAELLAFSGPGGPSEEWELEQWTKVHVGDDYDADVVGAKNAGWKSVLIDREASEQRSGLEWPAEPQDGAHLLDLLKSKDAVGFKSLAELAKWFPNAA